MERLSISLIALGSRIKLCGKFVSCFRASLEGNDTGQNGVKGAASFRVTSELFAPLGEFPFSRETLHQIEPIVHRMIQR